MKRKKTKIFIVGIIIIAVIMIIGYKLFFSQSNQRYYKDIQSNYFGGINRTVTVYDYEGNKLGEYTGKFDVEYKSDGTIKFDIDGKRTVITGGIIINQEN